MSASLSDTRNKWKKRKREINIGGNSKRQRPEDDDEDDEDDDELEVDEDEDLHPISTTTPTAADPLHDSRESEVLFDGGTRISVFPVVIKHTVNRPHSSVLAIVASERSVQFSDQRALQNPFFLENISHGQLQAVTAIPSDSPSLATSDVDGSSSAYVVTPPAIMEGRGVVKRFGNNRVLVVPMHADWFSPNSVHRLERQVVPHFFSGKSAEHTPEKYMDCRNRIVAKFMENPERRLSITDCHELIVGIDSHDLDRIVRFLDNWGIINYSVAAPNREPRIGGQYLREDPNGDIHVPSTALRSIDSLIHFDKPKSRLTPADVYSSLLSAGDGDSDLDSRIRERLSENHCNHCSRPLPRVHYQSQKEADILLCSDCFHEGRFVIGHSSIDFVRVDSAKDFCDLDGDRWTDQETLLLLEALEIFHDNWNDIAEHVGTKSKAQCILQFIRLPMDDGLLENIEVPSKSMSSNASIKEDHGRPYSNSNGDSAGLCLPDLSSESKLPFAKSGNPVMALVGNGYCQGRIAILSKSDEGKVAFLASAVGPRVAAACAHASLAALSKEDRHLVASNSIMQMEGSVHGDRMSSEGMHSREGGSHGALTSLSHQKEQTPGVQGSSGQNDALVAPLATERVKAAAKFGLAAAAMKSKLFADHEEREIQRMAASIINHQVYLLSNALAF
ncbi:hypothetical protein HHK36_007775 [Tetracentron sinense]|uniref:SWI/SNF complex subunit SWI3C n=1 Tax=Tetracentron sinense TaxID=13715 RepID=A0A834ZIB6_TETSI|nr:hypothetical protein HHK36_007775 [Tetracentron sinense]